MDSDSSCKVAMRRGRVSLVVGRGQHCGEVNENSFRMVYIQDGAAT